MKFLCRNCKAKYQIADDKVAGRTLRMTCQQCGEPIVVRGAPGRAQSQPLQPSRPLAPAALGASQTALGADFHRQLAAPGGRDHAVPAHEEWHVAINDVPVGPMRRDEVARKIAMGAIDRESLAWREGMDDWLALKHIGELSMLFNGAPSKSGSPPSAALMPSSAPSGPATRAEMAPIGGRQVVAVEEYDAAPEVIPELTVAAVAGPAHADGSAPSKPPGLAPMFALVCGGAFILAMGAWLGVRVLAPAPAAPVATAPVAAAPAAPSNPVAEAPAHANSVIELDTQAIDGNSSANARHSGGAATAAPASDKKPPAGKQLTQEQKDMLVRMGGGLNQGVGNIRAPVDTASSGPQGAALTADQLKAVVNGGRKNLQRCYETAMRGANTNDTVKLDVEISVSASGNVTSVHADGKNLPGMEECITRTVKMWRFPMSAESTQTRFPLVFQPGA